MVLTQREDSVLFYALKLLWRNFCCCFIDKSSASNFHYEKAPEPSDVFWENLNVTFVQRFKVVSLTYFLTAVIIGICFLVTWGLSELKDELNSAGNEDEGDEEEKKNLFDARALAIRFVTTLTSLFVVAVNKFLLIIITKFSAKERHLTQSAYNLSVAFKLTCARFFNSAIIPIFVNYYYEEWFTSGGLVQDVSNLIIAIAVADPLTGIFDVFYFKLLFTRWY